MNPKAFAATVIAGTFVLLAACGGDNAETQLGSATNSNQTQPTGSKDSGARVKYVAIDLGTGTGSGIGDGEQVGGIGRARLWRGSASSVVDLHPGGFWDGSGANAASGGIQVGWGQHDDNTTHALKWTGSASSVVDIHPDGLVRYSWAKGVSGGQIVGYGEVPYWHALLWTSDGVVDLNPSGATTCIAQATDGAQQVGGCGHAMLWRGTADSAVDLHPISGYSASTAYGVNGPQQVGAGWVGSLTHALLWSGTAQSAVDLHPKGFRESVAVAVAGGWQVGRGIGDDGSTHALLWNGTADSVVDLHVFVPAGFRNSEASGIDASGNIIGTAYQYSLYDGNAHAILWVPQRP